MGAAFLGPIFRLETRSAMCPFSLQVGCVCLLWFVHAQVQAPALQTISILR